MTIQQTFNDTYADTVNVPDYASHADMEDMMNRRNLNWKADETVSLEVAAEMYDKIEEHNAFNAAGRKMIGELAEKFAGEDITVTPAREWSVCIYLHIPEDIRETVFRFISDTLQADEVDWDGNTLRVWWD